MEEFNRIVSRAHEFSAFLLEHLGSVDEFPADERMDAAAAAAELSFEHAHALVVLFVAGTPNSAVAMLRLQYEALLRSAWLLYAAPEGQLQKVSVQLTQEAADAAKNIAGAEKMLEGLERKLVAMPQLRGLVLPLREIRDEAWTEMNAFVHAGFHPLARTQDGFPTELAANLVRFSCGMLHMSARLLARMTGPEELVRNIDQCYLQFEDCLPVVTAPRKG